MRLSLVVTFLNEEKTIEYFLSSLLYQTQQVYEVIMVDGGSEDATVSKIKLFQKKHTSQNIRLLSKRGNRSTGRNYGIEKSRSSIILLSDIGCELDRDWVEKISAPFQIPSVSVVAGYYKGKTTSIFQKCLLPYVLVMKDKIDSSNFLPSSRSMAIRKSVWKSTGGFPEQYTHNEDYVFARTLQKKNIGISFAKKAIVYWLPRSTFRQAFIMFYRFAFGDMQARIIRPKVVAIFLRYATGVALILFLVITKSVVIFSILCFLLVCYLVWSVVKNYRYVKRWQAIVILPLLQIISDVAVILGTSRGAFQMRLKSDEKGG